MHCIERIAAYKPHHHFVENPAQLAEHIGHSLMHKRDAQIPTEQTDYLNNYTHVLQ